jgi:hypothetical protein
MAKEDGSIDLLGLKPLAKSVEVITEGSVAGAGAFLSRICLPAAEEFGLMLRDKVSGWRARNAMRIAQLAEVCQRSQPNADKVHAHPRVVGQIIEHGSWEDSDEVQGMWAGLLASSCTEDGRDQQNLIFVNILGQITRPQALILNHACENATKYRSQTGLILANIYELENEQIISIMDIEDPHLADVQLDHLRELGLLNFGSGFDLYKTRGDITPSALGLNFYVRCQGYIGSPLEYFNVTETAEPS